MEKRVFLAIFLSFLVLVVYETQFAPRPVIETSQAPAPVAAPAAGASAAPIAGGLETPAAPTGAAPSTAVAVQPDARARDVIVETDAVTMVFSTQGAVLKSYRLRHYADAKGEPLELLPLDLPSGKYQRPFTLVTDDDGQSAALAAAVYEPSAERLSLGAQSGTLTFTYRDESGLRATKRFHFRPVGQPYVMNVEASVDVGGAPRAVAIAFGPGLGLGYNPDGSSTMVSRALHFLNGDVERVDGASLPAPPRYEGAMRYAGVDDHYFVAVALPGGEPARVDYGSVSLPVPGDATGLQRKFVTFAVRPSPAAPPAQTVTVPFFVGPKDFDQLRAADPELVRAIDFGMFRAIITPLLQALKWLNRYLGNYGWAIVVLTILINIIIFPLRHRSMVSMKKMQALQPQVKAIQDRYAKFKVTDPERQKMNTEMLALYKQKGVHPASGCIPMLLTMPILLAFYNLLSQAIELRGAPFVGWILDLSSKDPLYIWPILMGGTMFWQQKMMPTTGDPMQQKIMMFLPVIFTWMFLSMPSGLVIYWMVSNLLTIGQQYLTNRIIGGPPTAVVVPAPRKG